MTARINDLDAKTAETFAMNFLNNIWKFVNPLYQRHPTVILLNAVGKLDEFRMRIENPSIRFRNSREVDSYIFPILDAIIKHNPRLACQLKLFWDAHKEIYFKAINGEKEYNPFETLNKNREVIERIDAKFETVAKRFNTNPNDEVYIISLLYMHILRTEAVGIRLIDQFEKTLKRFDLLEKYNPAGVYSVMSVIRVLNNKGKVEKYYTDAEAIRHALAHNNYEIIYESDKFTIMFDNKKERNYEFKMSLEKQDFLIYIDEIAVLYKATLVLVYLLILRDIVRSRLLRNDESGG